MRELKMMIEEGERGLQLWEYEAAAGKSVSGSRLGKQTGRSRRNWGRRHHMLIAWPNYVREGGGIWVGSCSSGPGPMREENECERMGCLGFCQSGPRRKNWIGPLERGKELRERLQVGPHVKWVIVFWA